MSIYARLRVLLALLVLVIGVRVASRACRQTLRSWGWTPCSIETGGRFESAHDRAVKAAEGDRTATAQISALTATAREWQAHARIAVGQVERTGPKAASVGDARARKTLMDRLRVQDAALRRHLERRTETEL